MTRNVDEFASRTNRLDVVTIGEMDVPPDESILFTRKRIGTVGAEELVSFGGLDVDSVVLYLERTPPSTIFMGSERIELPASRPYESAIHDLRPAQSWLINHSLDIVSFDIPTRALERWAEENDVRHFGGLQFENGHRQTDEVIKGFGLALIPFAADAAAAPRIFIDYVLNAVCTHLARTYGTTRSSGRRAGGLAPWQERRAKEKIEANLNQQISLKSLADECRLSVSHFTKAFRESIGETPHQWLMQRRIDRSKELLSDGRHPLSEIAALCGFADQAHFTRTFAQRMGVAPGAWRRARAVHWIQESRRSMADVPNDDRAPRAAA